MEKYYNGIEYKVNPYTKEELKKFPTNEVSGNVLVDINEDMIDIKNMNEFHKRLSNLLVGNISFQINSFKPLILMDNKYLIYSVKGKVMDGIMFYGMV